MNPRTEHRRVASVCLLFPPGFDAPATVFRSGRQRFVNSSQPRLRSGPARKPAGTGS